MNRLKSLDRGKFGVFKSERIIDLAEIYEESVQIVQIAREPLKEISRELEKQQFKPFIHKEILSKDEIPSSEILNFLKENNLRHLKEDIEYLIQIYTDLLGSEKIGLRFGILESTLCPRFHTDYVGIRLVCTYSGSGTEYLYNSKKNRTRLQLQYEKNKMLDFQNIQNANPFDILLLKGENYPENLGSGAIHRSPIINPGEQRILMSIDWID